jgi:hypothetical protein
MSETTVTGLAGPEDSRLTEQLVVQETKAVRADLLTLRALRNAAEGLNLSEAAAVRLCIRAALPKLLAEARAVSQKDA